MTRLRLPIALLVGLALLGLPAAAEEEDPCRDAETGELVLSEQQVYIHQAETKAGNLAALGAGSFPSWNEEAPAQSVQQGAGGGYLTNSSHSILGEDEHLFGLTVEGTFTGCLDTMLLDLYAFLPTNRTGSNGDLQERAFIGTWTLYINDQFAATGEAAAVTEPNPLGSATYRIGAAFRKLDQQMKRIGADPTAENTIRLNVNPRYINTNNALFVYDTTEVPAGILFNGVIDPETHTPIG